MPKIRRQNLPPLLLDHLLDRIKSRQISSDRRTIKPLSAIATSVIIIARRYGSSARSRPKHVPDGATRNPQYRNMNAIAIRIAIKEADTENLLETKPLPLWDTNSSP